MRVRQRFGPVIDNKIHSWPVVHVRTENENKRPGTQQKSSAPGSADNGVYFQKSECVRDARAKAWKCEHNTAAIPRTCTCT